MDNYSNEVIDVESLLWKNNLTPSEGGKIYNATVGYLSDE